MCLSPLYVCILCVLGVDTLINHRLCFPSSFRIFFFISLPLHTGRSRVVAFWGVFCFVFFLILLSSGPAIMPAALTDSSQIICEVWASNVEEEMRKIRQIIQSYSYIAMVRSCFDWETSGLSGKTPGHAVCVHQDTEFPGVVVRPIGEFRSTVDYQYQLLRCNVDLLKIIQLGLTFMNEDGDYPPGTTTWQFNFKFNLTWVDLYFFIE